MIKVIMCIETIDDYLARFTTTLPIMPVVGHYIEISEETIKKHQLKPSIQYKVEMICLIENKELPEVWAMVE